MFSSSAFSAVTPHPDDSRDKQSSRSVSSPLNDRNRIAYPFISDQLPSATGHHPYFANPVQNPSR